MDTDFTAKLVDVREDGSTYNITEGIIRCRFREGLDRAKPLIPGAIYCYQINMGGTGMVLSLIHIYSRRSRIAAERRLPSKQIHSLLHFWSGNKKMAGH